MFILRRSAAQGKLVWDLCDRRSKQNDRKSLSSERFISTTHPLIVNVIKFNIKRLFVFRVGLHDILDVVFIILVIPNCLILNLREQNYMFHWIRNLRIFVSMGLCEYIRIRVSERNTSYFKYCDQLLCDSYR